MRGGAQVTTPRLVYRAAGNAERPPGLYRNKVHIAHWPAGVPALPESIQRVHDAWAAREGMHRPMTADEVRALLRQPRR
jgi:hypothetical protein